MHLGRHERGVGDIKIGDPACECFRLPARCEMFEATSGGISTRDHTEAADMVQRQRETPTGIYRDLKMCIHRICRNSQSILAQGDPFRRSTATGCFEKYLRLEFGEVWNRIHKTTRRTWRGVVPKIAMHQ